MTLGHDDSTINIVMAIITDTCYISHRREILTAESGRVGSDHGSTKVRSGSISEPVTA